MDPAHARGLSVWTWLAITSVAVATMAHLWAGWVDDGVVRLVPRGAGVALAMLLWLLALCVSVIAVVATRFHSRAAWASLVVAIAGSSVLFIPALFDRI